MSYQKLVVSTFCKMAPVCTGFVVAAQSIIKALAFDFRCVGSVRGPSIERASMPTFPTQTVCAHCFHTHSSTMTMHCVRVCQAAPTSALSIEQPLSAVFVVSVEFGAAQAARQCV